MMRRLLWLFAAAVMIATLMLCGCKTNEKNMSDAYTRAISARDDGLGLDSTIYNKVRREMTHGTMVVGSDSVDFSSQWVAVTKEAGYVPGSLKPFCVVVGQFKQLFNAKSMRERLCDGGYPDAFVVQTGEPYYFVVAGSFDDAAPALELLKKVRADSKLKMKEPLPFVLRPAQFR